MTGGEHQIRVKIRRQHWGTVSPSRPQFRATPITGELKEATSKYGCKYGWQSRVLRTEFRGPTPRNSGGPNLISWHSREIGVRISYGGDFSTKSARTSATYRPRGHHASLIMAWHVATKF